MLKIASLLVMSFFVYLAFSFVPNDMKHSMKLAVYRNVEMQLAHFRTSSR